MSTGDKGKLFNYVFVRLFTLSLLSKIVCSLWYNLVRCLQVHTTLIFLDVGAQVAQARYMSSSMWTFALLRDSSDLHIYKDLYGERNKPEKNEKLPLNYNKNRLPEFQLRFLCVLCDFLTDLERFSVV